MITTVCKQCGKEFKSHAAHRRKYCSRKCYIAFRRSPESVKEEAKRKAQGKKVSVVKHRPKATKVKTDTKTKRTCATCKYCVRSKGKHGDRSCYVCTNAGSEYCGAFLNVDKEGFAHKFVTWPGCDKWTGKGVAV